MLMRHAAASRPREVRLKESAKIRIIRASLDAVWSGAYQGT
jgi:hypothetical protein